MAVALEPLVFENFKGIREYNGVAGGGMISAISSYNTELFASDIGSGTGIKSMPGNVAIYTLKIDLVDYEPIGIYESFQDGNYYTFIYGESETDGALFYVNTQGIPTAIVQELPKSDNKECNALTMSNTAYDVFVFTNGKTARTVAFINNVDDLDAYAEVIKDHNPQSIYNGTIRIGYVATLEPKDPLHRADTITWLAMANWNGFLVVASEYGVRSSNQTDLYAWNDNPIAGDLTTSWYIDYSKKITALYAFTGGLYIFTKDDISFLNTTPNDTVNSRMLTASGNGCYSFQSIVKHDLYLFFYDNKNKNIYYLSATDTTGQIRPTGPVAKEIQSHFESVDNIKMFSCVYGVRNEIWCLINDEILVFDYINQEWTVRQEQRLNSLNVVDNHVYSCARNGKVLVENKNNDFDGDYYPSFYQTTYINAGSNSNLKKQKTPLLITVNDNHTNDFYVQLVINYKDKNPKTVKLASKNDGIFADPNDNSPYAQLETNNKYAYTTDMGEVIGAYYPAENNYSKKVIEISTPQTWYSMSVRIYTERPEQGFYITSMELKNIRGKLKTKGR